MKCYPLQQTFIIYTFIVILPDDDKRKVMFLCRLRHFKELKYAC